MEPTSSAHHMDAAPAHADISAPWLAGLNGPQEEAVTTLNGPLLVLSGAGTGKTRVLTARLAQLVASRTAAPWNILAVTFTNKAAREMKARIVQLVGPMAEQVMLGTFHSIAARMLRTHAEKVGLRSDFTILDTDDQLRLLKQLMEAEGRLPDALIACIGGGSNAMGLFYPFLDDKTVDIYGVEAAGHGIDTGMHAASLTGGTPGVLHGNRTYLLQTDEGQIKDAHSISAGLDYPGIGPEHAWLHDSGRVNYVSATDEEALKMFQLCSRLEGIIPALEPSHALAFASKMLPEMSSDKIVILNMCGRGDKDLEAVLPKLEERGLLSLDKGEA